MAKKISSVVLAVYGDFKNKDIRYKLFKGGDSQQFVFQNTLHSAKYDCNLIHINKEELEELFEDEAQQ